MSFDPEFLTMMPHTITVKPLSGLDAYGEPTYAAAVSYQAMVEERPELVRTQFGAEVSASHVVYVASTNPIDLTSQVTLPDGSTPDLIRSDIYSDEDGHHHVVLHFGSAAGG